MNQRLHGGSRSLLSGEIAFARAVFGDSLDYAAVRLRLCALIAPFADGVTIRNTIFLSRRCYRSDFAAADVAVTLQALLVHELMHVWQFQNLKGYHWLKAGLEHIRHFGRVYDYELGSTGPPALLDYRYEQQGRLLQDYYMLKRLGRDVSLYEAAIGRSFTRESQ